MSQNSSKTDVGLKSFGSLSILQSPAWAQFQQALGKTVVKGSGTDWKGQAVLTRQSGFSYLYFPYGPVVESASGLAECIGKLRGEYDFLRIEPMGEVKTSDLYKLGARPTIELNPSHSLVIDLNKSEAELRQALHSGHRSAINGAQRRGVSFRVGSEAEVESFLKLVRTTTARGGFRPHADSYYRTMMEVLGPLGVATLYVAEHEGTVVAASICLDYEDSRYYAHAAAAVEARKLQAAAPLVWQMLQDAKKAGKTRFDLWGVAPAEASSDHPWAGFSQFKRSFGGEEVEYVGTWDVPLKPVHYKAYLAARKLNRLVRR